MIFIYFDRISEDSGPSARGEIPKVEEPKATKMEPKGAKMTPGGTKNYNKYRALGNKMCATNGTTKKHYLANTIPQHATRSHYWDFKTSKINQQWEARWRGWAQPVDSHSVSESALCPWCPEIALVSLEP